MSTTTAVGAPPKAAAAVTTPKATTSTSSSTSVLSSEGAGLGKDAFLKLLIAQLKNQDPMKPMEDKEFIAQLAQFSSLETLQTLETRINSLLSYQSMDQASGLIGKRVEAEVTAVDGSMQTITGAVSEVRMTAGVPRLLVGTNEVTLDQIKKVLA